MAVTKRTRYEVLNRDDFQCRYCHAKDVPLTIDHVIPLALGGTDKPDNLVAACQPCNAGKSSMSPAESTVADVDEDAIRWATAVKKAADALLSERRSYGWFTDSWKGWDAELQFLPADYQSSLANWLNAGLPEELILDCHEIARFRRGVDSWNVFAYMGGICRNKIEDLHTQARALLDQEEN